MRILLTTALSLGLLSCSTSGGSGSQSSSSTSDKVIAIQGDLKSYEYVLPNGLTVVLTPNSKAPTTSIFHWVKVGSLHETPGITGIAHLFEHMMFRPLQKDAPTFDTLIRPLGGDINANTRYGATLYTTTVSNGKLSEALKLESDRFKKLVVTDDLLKVEREAVRSEYSMGIDSKPQMDLWFTLYSAGFPNHPYGWTIVGNRPDLDKISAKDCNEFFQKFYKPNNVGLFIAGDFDLEQAKAWVLANYGDWQKGEIPSEPAPFKNKGLIKAEGKLTAQNRNLLLGYRLEPINDKNFTLFTLADHLIANSASSLAKGRLVYGEKLASSVSSFNTDYDFGLSEFVVTLNPNATVDGVIEQFTKLPEDLEKISDAEYNAYLLEYQIGSAEAVLRNSGLNSALSLYWGKYGSVEALARQLKEPPHVPKAELVAYMKKLLDKNNLIAVTNKQKKD
jgi:zinc protease